MSRIMRLLCLLVRWGDFALVAFLCAGALLGFTVADILAARHQPPQANLPATGSTRDWKVAGLPLSDLREDRGVLMLPVAEQPSVGYRVTVGGRKQLVRLHLLQTTAAGPLIDPETQRLVAGLPLLDSTTCARMLDPQTRRPLLGWPIIDMRVGLPVLDPKTGKQMKHPGTKRPLYGMPSLGAEPDLLAWKPASDTPVPPILGLPVLDPEGGRSVLDAKTRKPVEGVPITDPGTSTLLLRPTTKAPILGLPVIDAARGVQIIDPATGKPILDETTSKAVTGMPVSDPKTGELAILILTGRPPMRPELAPPITARHLYILALVTVLLTSGILARRIPVTRTAVGGEPEGEGEPARLTLRVLLGVLMRDHCMHYSVKSGMRKSLLEMADRLAPAQEVRSDGIVDALQWLIDATMGFDSRSALQAALAPHFTGAQVPVSAPMHETRMTDSTGTARGVALDRVTRAARRLYELVRQQDDSALSSAFVPRTPETDDQYRDWLVQELPEKVNELFVEIKNTVERASRSAKTLRDEREQAFLAERQWNARLVALEQENVQLAAGVENRDAALAQQQTDLSNARGRIDALERDVANERQLTAQLRRKTEELVASTDTLAGLVRDVASGLRNLPVLLGYGNQAVDAVSFLLSHCLARMAAASAWHEFVEVNAMLVNLDVITQQLVAADARGFADFRDALGQLHIDQSLKATARDGAAAGQRDHSLFQSVLKVIREQSEGRLHIPQLLYVGDDHGVYFAS
jgi:hypothetical protein